MRSKNYFNRMSVVVTIILAIVGGGVLAYAAIPQTLSYQGKLVDPASGQPIPNGTYTIVFRIYNSQTGGTALWQESQNVPVQDGILSVTLGSVTAMNLPFDQEYWLSVQIGSDAEMARKKISSTAYSFRAKVAEGVQSGSVNTDSIVNNAITADKIAPTIVSSVDGVSNDSGNIDLIAGTNVTITPDDTANTITISATGGGVTDHGALTGLGDDDHPQYSLDTDLGTHTANASAHHTRYTDAEAKAAADDIATWGHSNLVTNLNADRLDSHHSSDFALASAVVTDHGALTGLGDDDHSQYSLDTDLSTHTANASAHHTRYTDAEAKAAADDITSWGHSNMVTNLNADLLDGNHASSFSTGPHVTSVNGLSGGTISSSVTVSGDVLSSRFYVSSAGNNNAFYGQNNSSSYPTIWLKNSSGSGAIYAENSGSNSPTIYGKATDTNAIHMENTSNNYPTIWARAYGSTNTIYARSSSSYPTIYGENNGSGYAGYFAGDLGCTGSKPATVSTQGYGNRNLYADESAEIYFFDRGPSRLVNGEVTIRLDPIFLETVTVNEQYPMLVQVTPTDDCNGLFVAKKTADSFTIKELNGGSSDTTFDWEVAAKRKGYEAVRMEEIEIILPEANEETVNTIQEGALKEKGKDSISSMPGGSGGKAAIVRKKK